MTKTYQDVLNEIESLKKEADELRRKELAAVISDIKSMIEKYNLSASDLGLESKKSKIKVKSLGADKVVKYRSDSNPEDTYGGKGPRPKWLQEKVAAGRKLEDFAV